jgi:hypothetical protein
MSTKQIKTRAELMALAKRLGVRLGWRRPGEQGLSAEVHGGIFDNTGYWGLYKHDPYAVSDDAGDERWVTLLKKGRPVGEVNLATLFAFACGWEG